MSQAALEELLKPHFKFLVFKTSSSPEEHEGPIWDPDLVQQQHRGSRGLGGLCAQLSSHITNSSFPAITSKEQMEDLIL